MKNVLKKALVGFCALSGVFEVQNTLPPTPDHEIANTLPPTWDMRVKGLVNTLPPCIEAPVNKMANTLPPTWDMPVRMANSLPPVPEYDRYRGRC